MADEFNAEKNPEALDFVEPSGPDILPYVPFPAFRNWLPENTDFSTFDKFAEQLQVTRGVSTPDALQEAVDKATRWAAINTGAIEGLYEADRGFTYTVAVSAAAWDDIHKLKGQAAAQSMQDAVNAYDFVLDCVTQSRPITEVWIRQLHEIVAASQDTFDVITAIGPQEQILPKGQYKSQPNSPLNIASNTVHSYAPPVDTSSEMARLVEELRSTEFQTAHPIAQAAYAHYAFVCVHPFADGNGRVSRALASVFTYREPGVPVVIFADQKSDYLDALEAADAGNPAQFIRFVSERVIDTVQMVRSEISKGLVPNVAEQMAQLAMVLSGKEGISHAEIDAIAVRGLDVFQAAMESELAGVGLLPPMAAGMQRYNGGLSIKGVPAGYRPIPGTPPGLVLSVNSQAPASGSEQRSYGVAIARPGTEAADFVIHSATRTLVEFDLREIRNSVSPALVYRCESEAQRDIRETVAGVAVQATNSLRKAGYL